MAMFVLFVVFSFTITSTYADEEVETVKLSKAQYSSIHYIGDLNRSSFPKGFIFGAGSSSYQGYGPPQPSPGSATGYSMCVRGVPRVYPVEGAANQGGKGPSIWDTFTDQQPGSHHNNIFLFGHLSMDILTVPTVKVRSGCLGLECEKIKDGSNADITIDQYHRYKEDVEIAKDQNMDYYRFSISWPRILPKGKLSGGINQEGIAYYNNLINELLHKGVKPFVTLFHWEVPQVLEDEYDGFLNSQIIDDFQDYADLCFKEFGNRVKYWVTLNEPYQFTSGGYANGQSAPGRCSNTCLSGNSGTEPYIVAHNLILAHAKVVQVYKTKYQALFGKIAVS
ncbi:hypothetical protein TSUD_396610 [Trifolium subterraneum]|uniref:Beta-glucosidase n=1 Tax=Trifolium subterraneum TaxID=3900 RepID=A0A2Z6N5C4_TRISU|nr:hypothetical protein TSUD_396610 [Trifolium subterraneum]